jgi:hypothetical protein
MDRINRFEELGRTVVAKADMLNERLMRRGAWEITRLAEELAGFAGDILAEVALFPGKTPTVMVPLKSTDLAEDKLLRILRTVHFAIAPRPAGESGSVCAECRGVHGDILNAIQAK